MSIFDQITKLYTKEEIENPESDFILNRFLSSDIRYASVAQDLGLICRNRKRMWRIWQDALPKADHAPFFKYVAPKKKTKVAFIEKYAKAHNLTMNKAEDELDILGSLGKIDDLKTEMGVE